MSLTMRVDMAGLSELLDELEDAALSAARPAAQAGTQVLYDEVRRNVAQLGQVSGNLAGAIYQVYSRDNCAEGRATYHVSWNTRKAPHGQLVEFGHVQRYATYIGRDGKWYTAVRAEMRGKRRPGRWASTAQKDAYYVKLPQPKQVPAKSFVRAAMVRFPAATEAVERELLRRIA